MLPCDWLNVSHGCHMLPCDWLNVSHGCHMLPCDWLNVSHGCHMLPCDWLNVSHGCHMCLPVCVMQEQCLRILHGFVERLECVTEGGRKDLETAEDIDGACVSSFCVFVCMCMQKVSVVNVCLCSHRGVPQERCHGAGKHQDQYHETDTVFS